MSILTQKEAKKLGRSNTIDMRAERAESYLASKYNLNSKKNIMKHELFKWCGLIGCITLAITIITGWSILIAEKVNAYD